MAAGNMSTSILGVKRKRRAGGGWEIAGACILDMYPVPVNAILIMIFLRRYQRLRRLGRLKMGLS